MNAGMNYGEDELGSFGDENEIKVSQRGVSLVVVPSNVSIQMKNLYFPNLRPKFRFQK